jgi:hypothetical protein
VELADQVAGVKGSVDGYQPPQRRVPGREKDVAAVTVAPQLPCLFIIEQGLPPLSLGEWPIAHAEGQAIAGRIVRQKGSMARRGSQPDAASASLQPQPKARYP